ncbi:MAG: amino acid adenylation domain-containing protein [Sedimentibacter sp.]
MDNNIEKIYSLTPLQQGMIYHKLLDEGSSSYHVQNTFWLKEKIREENVEKSLFLICQKYEVLRTAFVLPNSTGVPRQLILADRKIELKYEAMYGRNEKKETDFFIQSDLNRGFDLQKDSLMRVHFVTFGEKRNWFMFSFHHIIMDGWCISLVFADFIRFIDMLKKGMSQDEILSIINQEKESASSYSDYITWMESKNKLDVLDYWKHFLSDYGNIASIESMEKPKQTESQMAKYEGKISKETFDHLKQIAYGNQITVNYIAEAAWGILLQKFNYIEDVVFGKVVSGRDAPVKGIDKIVGLFINTVPCRVNTSEDCKVIELCKKLFVQGIESSEYEYCSLSAIQAMTSQGTKLIQSLVNFENYYLTEARDGIEKDYAREETNYPLTVNFYEDEAQLNFNIMYNPNEYAEVDIANIAAVLCKIFSSIAENPDCKVSELTCIDDVAYQKIITEFNNTDNPLDYSKNIMDYFSEQVKKNPNKIAVEYNDETLTYTELNLNAKGIAWKLQKLGVNKNDCVGIVTEKSVEVIAGIYGILMTGAAYVPLSLDNPEERMNQIISDCNPKAVVMGKEKIDVNVPVIDTLEKLRAGKDWREVKTSADDIAYIMYTSGTTGRPKGAMIQQINIINLVKNCNYTKINEDSVILQAGDIAFDASTFEIHGALLNGGTVCLADKSVLMDEKKMKMIIHDKKINTMFLTASLFNQILSIDESVFDEMKYMLVGGEQLNDKYVRMYQERNLPVVFTNGYGPTETTTFAVCCIMDIMREKTPIGKPLQNVKAYVFNRNQMCGIGMPGELCIAGKGVGKGYLNHSELTVARFVENPVAPGNMYRTGDLVRWMPDGNIDYMGRLDDQEKVHGYRIELGEIKTACKSFEQVKEAVAVVKTSEDGNKRIYAYITSDEKVDLHQMKENLTKKIPVYMVPYAIIQVEKFALNKNGKIDKKTLPEFVLEESIHYVAPTDKVEIEMCNIVAEVLKIERIGVKDHFVENGCDSIKAMKLRARLNSFGYKMSISDIYMYDTVEELARFVEAKKEIFLGSSLKGHPVFNDFYEVKEYLSARLEEYENMFLGLKIEEKLALTAGQSRMVGNMTIMSGSIIKFEEDINMDALNKSIMEVINSQILLRSTLEKKTFYICEQLSALEIPFLNLMDCSNDTKDEVRDYLTSKFYGLQDKKKGGKTLLHKIVAVKYSEKNFWVYFPINHVIFDAMSGEILCSEIKRRYYGIEGTKDNITSFTDYAKQIRKGPNGVTTSDIVQTLKIKEFSEASARLGEADQKEMSNYIISLDIGANSEEFDKKDLWNISYKLFLKLLAYNFDIHDYPFMILCVNRQYENNIYNNTIGEFVDVLPITDTLEGKMNYELVQERIRWMSDNNVNLSTLLLDKGILVSYIGVLKAFLKAGPHMEKIPYFNYLAMYNEVVEQNAEIQIEKLLEEIHGITRTVDIKIGTNTMDMVVFGPVGEEDRLINVLQNYLYDLIKQYKK